MKLKPCLIAALMFVVLRPPLPAPPSRLGSDDMDPKDVIDAWIQGIRAAKASR